MRIAPAAFATTYCVAYAAVFALHWPLFVYYPLIGKFSFARGNIIDAGPVMAWYGLMASAGLFALLVAAIVKDEWLTERLRGKLWVFPVAAMVACVYLLKVFFI